MSSFHLADRDDIQKLFSVTLFNAFCFCLFYFYFSPIFLAITPVENWPFLAQAVYWVGPLYFSSSLLVSLGLVFKVYEGVWLDYLTHPHIVKRQTCMSCLIGMIFVILPPQMASFFVEYAARG